MQRWTRRQTRRRTHRPPIAVSLSFCLCALAIASPAGAQVYITELMAVNDTVLIDEDGDFSDWLELHNASAATVDLTGWYLTDDDANLTRWQLPAVTISAGGHLVVFASGKDRAVAGAELHTSFKLSSSGEYLALVRADGTTIEHAYAPAFPPQDADVSYGLASDLTTERCFFDPTPGAANDETTACGFVEPLAFGSERGFYDDPMSIEISTATADASIYYTLDGSEPTPTAGTLYETPLSISGTTTLRAAAFATGLRPTPSVTHTYIYLDDVLGQTGAGFPETWANDYEMDPEVIGDPRYSGTLKSDLLAIPTISMVMAVDDLFGEENGIYSHPGKGGIEWERPVSAELISPDGSPGFQVNCGTRIQGDLSRSLNHKKSFRLAFKSDYGPARLDYPFFGPSFVTSFDKLRLRASSEKSWSVGNKRGTYVRDQWVRNTQLAMGRSASRGIFVHLYLNGLYWGLYNVVEKPDESFAADHLGGEPEEWDVHKHPFEVVNGNSDAWYTARALALSGLESPAAYAAIRQFVDVPNLIDYFIANLHAGTTDWDGNNWFAARRRLPGEGFQFFSWDAEQSMVSVKTKRVTIANDNRPSTFYSRLRDNAEFRVLFGDHVHAHFFNEGVLTPGRARQRFLELTTAIDGAIVAESARWGDAETGTALTRDDDWLVEVEWLRLAYFPRRTAIVLDQFRDIDLYPAIDAPVFSTHGGFITAGDSLAISATAGTIYTTLDGSDPRLAGGAVSPTAVAYLGPITLVADTTVRSRALHDGEWSALNAADFTIEVSLRITELMYHPSVPPTPGPFVDDDFEFVELMNVGTAPLDLGGVSFTDGIDFTFGPATLAPGSRTVLVSNATAFESRYGAGLPVAGQYTGRLANSGERVRLESAGGGEIHDFTYEDGWFPATDGGGAALVVTDTGADRAAWGRSDGWRAGVPADGTPGAAELPLCADGVDNDGDGLTDVAEDPGCAEAGGDSENPECDDGLDNDGDGQIDLADSECAQRSHDSEAPPPLDTFVCYQARTNPSVERFGPVEVTLTDALDGATSHTVTDPSAICVPGSIDGSPIIDAAVHLEGYRLHNTPETSKHDRRTGLFMRGLGPVFLDTLRPETLLVPASMDPTSPPTAPVATAHDVDHYKCYKARITKRTPKYWPKGVQLRAADSLEDRAYDLKRPTRLCTVVEKNGEGIKHPERRMICYQAKRAKGEPKHAPRIGIHTATQFGSGRLDTRKVESICMPAT